MPWVLLLLLLAAGGTAAAAPASGVQFFKGKPRTITFRDGKSNVARLAQLRALFGPTTKDLGNGRYLVTPEHDMTASVPSGSAVVGRA
jgi:hypothetical protein